MARLLLFISLALGMIHTLSAQDTPAGDSTESSAETIFVIPAGPVAGSFTQSARLVVQDTIAGWAKIQVEGWVPVGAVMDRLENSASNPAFDSPSSVSAAPSSTPRQQCAAITKKGTRCKRMALPGSPYCWQHQPDRKK